MRRVLVIGCGGAGKTTFSPRLAGATGLPVVHLDSLYWHPGWVPTPDHEWDRTVAELLERPAWIMDGNYGRTLERRLGAADTVVFLDMPRTLCLWRILKRRFAHEGKTRPSVAAGCPERLTLEFLWWVWTYPERRRAGILARLEKLSGDKKVVVLRRQAEIERFLAGLFPPS